MLHTFVAQVQPKTATRFGFVVMLAAFPALTGCHLRPALRPYEGQWVLNARQTGSESNSSTRPLMTLKLSQHHRSLKGVLVMPAKFHEEEDGTFNTVETPAITRYVTAVRWGRPQLDLVLGKKPGRSFFPIMLAGPDHLVIDGFVGQVPPWLFERETSISIISLATDWPHQEVTTSK